MGRKNQNDHPKLKAVPSVLGPESPAEIIGGKVRLQNGCERQSGEEKKASRKKICVRKPA